MLPPPRRRRRRRLRRGAPGVAPGPPGGVCCWRIAGIPEALVSGGEEGASAAVTTGGLDDSAWAFASTASRRMPWIGPLQRFAPHGPVMAPVRRRSCSKVTAPFWISRSSERKRMPRQIQMVLNPRTTSSVLGVSLIPSAIDALCLRRVRYIGPRSPPAHAGPIRCQHSLEIPSPAMNRPGAGRSGRTGEVVVGGIGRACRV